MVFFNKCSLFLIRLFIDSVKVFNKSRKIFYSKSKCKRNITFYFRFKSYRHTCTHSWLIPFMVCPTIILSALHYSYKVVLSNSIHSLAMSLYNMSLGTCASQKNNNTCKSSKFFFKIVLTLFEIIFN